MYQDCVHILRLSAIFDPSMLTHYCVLPMQDVSRVEADLLNILQGGAPKGFEYHDVEEEYVIDPATNVGSWQRAKPAAETAAPAAAAAAAGVGGSGQAAAGAATAGGPLAAIGPADGGQEAAAGSAAGGSRLKLKAKIPGLAKKAKVAPTPSPPQPH